MSRRSARTDTGRALRAWARTVAESSAVDGHEHQPIEVVAAVVVAVAGAIGCGGSELDGLIEPAIRRRVQPLVDRLPQPPDGWADPWLPGVAHEQAVSGPRRSARGAWYTPRPVVDGLVTLATADGRPPARVVDPTCGGGAFLLAALDRYRYLGLSAEEALGRVAGTDIDEDAVRTSRWGVQLWAAANGMAVAAEAIDLDVRDVLDGAPRPGALGSSGDHSEGRALAGPGSGGDGEAGPLIIGNPPFATPLRSGRLPDRAEALRSAHRDLLGPYSDLAAIHFVADLLAAPPGSTVALVLPQSVLAGRDTRSLREYCDREAPLQALWATRTAVFDAGVRACAVVVRVGGTPPAAVVLAAGPAVELVERAAPAATDSPWPEPLVAEPGEWAGHAASALGAPVLPAAVTDRGAATIGDLATATAGFRDEYYGLVGACQEWQGEEGSEPNRLVTVGAVDPLDLAWGRQPCRLGGRQWMRPVIDRDRLDDKIAGWVDRRLVPKVVLATQSKVLEPVVDRRGALIPATPLIAVAASADDLDLIAAVLLAPPVVALAWQRWFGSGLSVDSLKLAARQVLELPLPPDRPAWEEAAALVAEADGAAPAKAASVASAVGEIMNRAYRADDAVLRWWLERRGTGVEGEGGPRSAGPETIGPG